MGVPLGDKSKTPNNISIITTFLSLVYAKFWVSIIQPSPKVIHNFWNIITFILLVFAVINTYTTTINVIGEIRGNGSVTKITDNEKYPNRNRDLVADVNGDEAVTITEKYKSMLVHTDVYNRSADTNTQTVWELLGSPEYMDVTSQICNHRPPKKFLSKQFYFTQPKIQEQQEIHPQNENSNYNKLIPRIIHQSWYQTINDHDFPNLSRIQNSWKKATGWKYNFYNDDDAANYIKKHFPIEIFEAYDAIMPGAFKADFFRYCALFYEGGIWADIDMQLQTNLDNYITPNIGFVVPRDIGGHGLHNALIISAPGHPILAKAIEEATNMIRNRYTIIDIAGRYCPKNVNNEVLRDHMSLFITGPGLLAYAMHAALNFPLSVPFKPGVVSKQSLLELLEISPKSQVGQQFLKSQSNSSSTNDGYIPGETIVLERIVGDMGETRYTDLKRNWIIAGTDIPGGYDKQEKEHYSATVIHRRLWGLHKVYKDRNSANEQIRIRFVKDDDDHSLL